MSRIAKVLVITSALFIFGGRARANTINAASCSSSSVQAAINSASEGDTVNVPPGTCSWTSGIRATGVKVVGAGAGRVIAIDYETTALTLGTGTKTWNTLQDDTKIDTNSANCGGSPPCLDTLANSVITAGETLRIIEDGWFGNYMQGTVTSYSGGVLTMNITSAAGTCGQTDNNGMSSDCKRWMITTLPSTIICNNSTLANGPLFNLTESTAYDTGLSGIFIGQENDPRCSGDTANALPVNLVWTSGGMPILIHDMFFERSDFGSNSTIDGNTNRGVVWNTSFAASPFSADQNSIVRIKDDQNISVAKSSWTSPAAWGSTDTNENLALYVESDDVHAYGANVTDCDSGCRLVFRYSVLDNSSLGSHGADTSTWGMRTMEVYDFVGWYQADGSATANLPHGWYYVRGGTFVFHDNFDPAITGGGYWASVNTLHLTQQNLHRNVPSNAPNACWGAGNATPSGQNYPAPRQVGFGYVTGTGHVSYAGATPNPVYAITGSTDSVGYVGDSEPIYVWNNNPAATATVEDYPLGQPDSCPSNGNPDSSANYIVQNRDYFLGTAKPSYTPAAYPNPYTGSQPSSTPVAPTPMIMTADNVAQYLFGAPLPCGQRGTCEAAARP